MSEIDTFQVALMQNNPLLKTALLNTFRGTVYKRSIKDEIEFTCANARVKRLFSVKLVFKENHIPYDSKLCLRIHSFL